MIVIYILLHIYIHFRFPATWDFVCVFGNCIQLVYYHCLFVIKYLKCLLTCLCSLVLFIILFGIYSLSEKGLWFYARFPRDNGGSIHVFTKSTDSLSGINVKAGRNKINNGKLNYNEYIII